MNWMQRYKQRVEQENPQRQPTPQAVGVSVTHGVSEPLTEPTRTPAVVEDSTPVPSSVATDRPEVSERTPTEPMPAPKAAATDPREALERKRKSPTWRFEDSPEVKKRLAAGWRIVSERVCTNGTSYYSEPEGWVWQDGAPPPVLITVVAQENGGQNG